MSYNFHSSPAMVSLTGTEFLETGFSLSLPPTPNLLPGVPSNKPLPPLESLSLKESKFSRDQKSKWTVGRAPWYDESGNRNSPLIIGVTGGSASGKTSVCDAIIEKLSIPWVQLLSMDRYYKALTPEQKSLANAGNYNFDHPDAFDMDKLISTIEELKTGKVVDIPIYDFATHSRLESTDKLYGVDVVIVEGILVLYDERVRNLFDLMIYVDTDADIRLARRLQRDVRERGRTVEGVLGQYMTTVKTSFEQFILPTKRHAHVIIPWNETNPIALNLIGQHIVSCLEKRSKEHIRKHNVVKPKLQLPSDVPPNVYVMERTNNLQALHTVVRDSTADSEDWAFALNRLVNLIVSYSLNIVNYVPCAIQTPTDSTFEGLEPRGDVVTVSIIRTGEVFESAIRSNIPEARHGKLVIQQSNNHKAALGPRLYSANLPENIQCDDTTVLLFDGVLSTGGAVIMAIQVLLDHGVALENIVFCCIVAAPEGLHKLMSTFPLLRIVASWVDVSLDKHGYCFPGIGYLGDRYFGTNSLVIGERRSNH